MEEIQENSDYTEINLKYIYQQLQELSLLPCVVVLRYSLTNAIKFQVHRTTGREASHTLLCQIHRLPVSQVTIVHIANGLLVMTFRYG